MKLISEDELDQADFGLKHFMKSISEQQFGYTFALTKYSLELRGVFVYPTDTILFRALSTFVFFDDLSKYSSQLAREPKYLLYYFMSA